MAEKYSVLIKYKYLDYIKNANLSDADSWVIMKALIEYDKTGEMPTFKKQVLTGLFAVLKYDLDENREKWEERVATNRNNGKKGGRPRKADKNPKNPVGYKKPSGGQHNRKNPAGADSGGGSGNDLDSEFDLESSSENIFINNGGGSSGQNEKPPQPPIENIKKESGAQGFFIDTAIARKFQTCGVDPSWLDDPFSFLEFSAETIRKKYPDKNNEALKPLFISAVSSWEDFREAYPHWRKEREKEARIKAQKEARKKAEDNKPQKCQCGGELNNRLVCQSCGGFYHFDESDLQYKYDPPIDENVLREWKKKMGKYSGKCAAEIL